MPKRGGEQWTDTPDRDRCSEWVDPGSVSPCWRKERGKKPERHLIFKQTAEPNPPNVIMMKHVLAIAFHSHRQTGVDRIRII